MLSGDSVRVEWRIICACFVRKRALCDSSYRESKKKLRQAKKVLFGLGWKKKEKGDLFALSDINNINAP